MKKILFLLGMFSLPIFASAHTKWFASETLSPYHGTEPTSLYLLVAFGIGLVIISVTIILNNKNLCRLTKLRPEGKHAYERAASAFTITVGAFFLIAGTHEYLFSPNQNLESGIPYYLIVTQILIGLAFLLGIATRTFSLLLIAIWLLTFHYLGTVTALENIWVLSTAIFILIMGNDYFSLISFSYFRKIFKPFTSYALSLLRLGTGTTLMILGLSEKILAPEYGLNFLDLYHWNFMHNLGFSDYLFTISAGAVEFTLGLLLVLGIATRSIAIITAIIFTIPLFILGPIELAGHLPHFAAIVMLILFGNGGHFTFFKKYNDERV
jgi:uncharacterized membrane protein YphA (DoxX/SURF4 family)